MTVAAVILAASSESALREAAGRAVVRRLAETAWAGGAVPVVVVAPEQDGRVAGVLAGSAAILAEPAPREGGPVAQIARGIEVAASSVAETVAALVWPARLAWVDAETVTTLIQAHGLDGASVLRPAWHGEAGWPVLLPVELLAAFRSLGPGRMPDELIDDLAATGVSVRLLELGDPGVVLDVDTAMHDLPPYEGPESPLMPSPDWGAAAADQPDDVPLEGPALAPYDEAAADDA